MTTDAVLDKVLSVTRGAVGEGLLSDVDSLSAGIEAAGWVRAVEGGRWLCPDEPSWSLWPSGHAPNLAVFFEDEDAAVVFTTGQKLSRLLDHDQGLHRQGLDPGWPAWSPDDLRWTQWTGLEADWVMWDGGPARISLNVRPAHQLGRIRVAPHLHFQIERLDTPSEGLPPDHDRARRITRSGSSLARWYLAGEADLPEDVVNALSRDGDPTVVAAVEAGDKIRSMHVASEAFRRTHDAS